MLTPELEDTISAARGILRLDPGCCRSLARWQRQARPAVARVRCIRPDPRPAEGIAGIAEVSVKLADGLADNLLQLDLRRRKPRRDLMPAYHNANGQIPEAGWIEAKNNFPARALD